MTRDFQYLPLRHVAAVKNSNVDKLSLPGESPVRLCNYVDVYRNDRITQAVSFMRASATPSEITSFKLRLGDVLITKDSEQWNDIGVPALVATEADDLVCGYHLTMLRPHPSKIMGSYLAYALRVPEVAVQLHLAAKGVTRYGLSQQGIKSALVPVPLLEEQGLIVRYLDHAELRIAKAIAAKQTMVSLMEEQRSAVVAHEMLGGENKRTAVKQLEGFGEIPAHWEVMTLRGLLRKIALRNPGGHQLLSVLRSRGVIERSLDRADNHNFIPDDLSNYKVVKPGDLVMNKMKAWSGSVGVSRHRGVVSPAYFVYEFRSPIDPAFMNLLFRSNYMRYWFGRYSEGVRVGQWDLSPEEIKNIRVPVPALEEQVAISERVVARTSEMDAAIASVQAEIALLKEYRIRLISDVVTGKMDVRDEAAKLPEIDPMELATVAVGENGDDEEATDDD